MAGRRSAINALPIDRLQIIGAADALSGLGSSSQGANQTLALLCNPSIQAKDVAASINREPRLYARVLRVANSAYFGQSRCITNLDRAIVVLGLDAVRGIAAAACLDRSLRRSSGPSLIDTALLLRHSLATAAAAESLARLRDPESAPEAFIAGLLHNLGIIVQLRLDPPGIAAMLGEREAHPTRDMRSLENERTVVGHEECMAVIFEAWDFPDCLVAATRHHHEPLSAPAPYRRLAALVNLGANLGLAGGHTFDLEPAAVMRNEAAMQMLGLEEQQVDDIALELSERVSHLRHALG